MLLRDAFRCRGAPFEGGRIDGRDGVMAGLAGDALPGADVGALDTGRTGVSDRQDTTGRGNGLATAFRSPVDPEHTPLATVPPYLSQ